MVDKVMHFISGYQAWIISGILMFAIPALFWVVVDIFREAVTDIKSEL